MTDYSELKRLAEAATQCSGPRRVETDYNGVHQVIGDGSWKILNAWHTPDGKSLSNAQFAAAANPAAVLDLIAENERLNSENKQLILLECHGGTAQAAVNLLAERDQLRTELAGLRTGYDAYEGVVAGLKAEVEALRKLVSDTSLELRRASSWICREVESGTQSATHWAIRLRDKAGQIGAAISKEAGHD